MYLTVGKVSDNSWQISIVRSTLLSFTIKISCGMPSKSSVWAIARTVPYKQPSSLWAGIITEIFTPHPPRNWTNWLSTGLYTQALISVWAIGKSLPDKSTAHLALLYNSDFKLLAMSGLSELT